MKRIIILITTLGALVLFNTVQASVEIAEQNVKNTTEEVLSRIKAEKQTLETNPEIIYDLIDEVVIPHFDFIKMSRWVLGKNWKLASQDQRDRFVNAFRTLLIRTYAKALQQYSDEKIEYLQTEGDLDSKFIIIKTRIKRQGSKIIPIDYRMYNNKEAWKVIDIIVDNVSLVSTYRGSFASEIRQNGIDSLIIHLSEKNNKI